MGIVSASPQLQMSNIRACPRTGGSNPDIQGKEAAHHGDGEPWRDGRRCFQLPAPTLSQCTLQQMVGSVHTPVLLDVLAQTMSSTRVLSWDCCQVAFPHPGWELTHARWAVAHLSCRRRQN